eukprot:gene13671-biopygen23065
MQRLQGERTQGLAGADRMQKVAIWRPKKHVPVLVGTPSGSDMARRRHPPGSRNFRDLGGFWRPVDPQAPPPPQRHGRAGRQLPAGPQHPQAPGIANPALARVLGSEWRKRIPAYTAAPMQMHQAPGLDGADRTQKVAIWLPKNRFRGPLAPHRGRIWLPGGTARKSKIPRFCWILVPGGPPRPPPLPPQRDGRAAGSCRLGRSIPRPPGSPIQP